MQTQLATGDPASSILNKPDHILSFIKHALESAASAAAPPAPTKGRANGGGLHLEDLRIVEEDEDEVPEAEEGDSDDEEPELAGSGDDEMVATSVNLLLSILEGMLRATGHVSLLMLICTVQRTPIYQPEPPRY